MTAAVEARFLIRDVAGPMPAGSQIQEMLNVVARKTGLGARRLRGIWNSEARAIRAEEIDALRRAAAERKREKQEALDRNVFRELAERLAFLEQRMAEIDPSFPRSTLDACGPSENALGHTSRPMAQQQRR